MHKGAMLEGGGVVSTANTMTSILASQTNGLFVTVTGLLVVFGVLILLWIVLEALNYAFREPESRDTKKSGRSEPELEDVTPRPTDAVDVQPESTFTPTPDVKASPSLEPEVPAIITAAVIAALGKVPDRISIHKMLPSAVADPEVAVVITAAVTQALGYTPEAISIRRVYRQKDPSRVAAISAAVATLVDDARSITIKHIERGDG